MAFIVYSFIPMMLPGTFSNPGSSLIFQSIYDLVKSPAACCAPIELPADLLVQFPSLTNRWQHSFILTWANQRRWEGGL